jgi:hypothetical protein
VGKGYKLSIAAIITEIIRYRRNGAENTSLSVKKIVSAHGWGNDIFRMMKLFR